MTLDPNESASLRPHPLTEQNAGELAAKTEFHRALWVVPFRPGDDLVDDIEKALARVSKAPATFRAAGLLPCFAPEPPGVSIQAGSTVETRLLPSWWGLLPGDAYPAEVRQPFRELFRLLCPEKYFAFLAFENFALAGIDLYVESLMGRFEQERLPTNGPSRAPLKPPLIFGVCGTDGSGKSSHVAALRDHLEGLGLRVRVRKIYRHGIFHDAVTDLTRQCAQGKNLHLWRLQRIIKAFDSVKYFYASIEEDLENYDALVFDRYIFTHFAAGAGRYHHDPFAREILTCYPPAHRIYLLDVPTGEALARIDTRKEKTVDENFYMLSRYRHALLDLGDRHGFRVLDARNPFEENRSIILEDAGRLVESMGLGRR
jgi:thymidylate kinase